MNVIPDRFYCPINLDVMSSPMQLPCKHNFQREAILQWLGKKNTCPTCRYELKWYQTPKTNRELQNEIIQYFNENPELEMPKDLERSSCCMDIINTIKDRILLVGLMPAQETIVTTPLYNPYTPLTIRMIFDSGYYP